YRDLLIPIVHAVAIRIYAFMAWGKYGIDEGDILWSASQCARQRACSPTAIPMPNDRDVAWRIRSRMDCLEMRVSIRSDARVRMLTAGMPAHGEHLVAGHAQGFERRSNVATEPCDTTIFTSATSPQSNDDNFLTHTFSS